MSQKYKPFPTIKKNKIKSQKKEIDLPQTSLHVLYGEKKQPRYINNRIQIMAQFRSEFRLH